MYGFEIEEDVTIIVVIFSPWPKHNIENLSSVKPILYYYL